MVYDQRTFWSSVLKFKKNGDSYLVKAVLITLYFLKKIPWLNIDALLELYELR